MYKQYFRKVALLSFSVLFTLLGIELYLRIYQPFGFRLRGQEIILPTNVIKQYKTHTTPKLDPYITIKKNSLGFRGPEPPKHFTEYISIITVGGSTTESLTMSEGKTWTDLLAQRLNKNFSSLWVNNAGIDGHSSFGHSLLLDKYLVRLKPKYILFLIGVNDLYLFQGRAFDVLEPKKEKGVLDRLFSQLELTTLYTNIQRKRATEALNIQSSEVIDFSSLSLLNEKYPEYKDVDTATASDSVYQSANYPVSEESSYLSAYAERLEHLIDRSRAANIEPIFITQPAVYGHGIDDVTGIDLSTILIQNSNGEKSEGLIGKEAWKVLEKYNDVTRNISNKHTVFTIDLAQKMPKSTQYYYDFVHFSNDGSQKVAEIIYSELCTHLWMKEKTNTLESCEK